MFFYFFGLKLCFFQRTKYHIKTFFWQQIFSNEFISYVAELFKGKKIRQNEIEGLHFLVAPPHELFEKVNPPP